MLFDRIDIFCDVIDNFGDAGVTYRLARALKAELVDSEIRLFTNGLEVFSKIDCGIDHKVKDQVCGGIRFSSYDILTPGSVEKYEIPELVIEAFACHIPAAYYEKVLDTDCLIINLDHLSAEKWIEGVHLKESLTGRKAKKIFFMPGLTSASGGIIPDRQLSDWEMAEKRKYFENLYRLESGSFLISVFTYEHDFHHFISNLNSIGRKVSLIVFGEKSQRSIRKADLENEKLTIKYSDFLPQAEYDGLLKVCDLNFVRGEDSWARTCLSKKPFVWHAYHQKDNYQQVKVKAFLEYLMEFYTDPKLYELYSSYMMKFNDRSGTAADESAGFMLQHAQTLERYNISLSEHLIKNCNLINNLLFFAGSLKNDK